MISATVTYEGRELATLNRLLQQRVDILREEPKKAVVATAINCMVSLRAQTRKAQYHRGQVQSSAKGTVEWRTKAGRHRRVLIINGSKVAAIDLSGKGRKEVSVFTLNVYREKKETTLYVIARSQSAVERYAKRRINRYKGQARAAWSVLMSKVGTRNESSSVDISHRAKMVLSRTMHAVGTETRDTYGLAIANDLNYAVSALQGGSGSVSLAIQKAANKMAGRLKQFTANHPKLTSQRVETPFPEIVRVR